MALALVSPRRNRRPRAQTPILTIEHQHSLFQMAQAWPGPAQARPGPDFVNLGKWKSRNLESKKISQMKKNKIKSMSPKMSARSGLAGKNDLFGPFCGHPDPSSAWTEQNKNPHSVCLPWWANRPYSRGLCIYFF